MKRYCLIQNGEIVNIGGLPTNTDNVSNFYLLSDEALKFHGWLPVETISENKQIQEEVQYVIEENVVKEIIKTRDRTQKEIDEEIVTNLDTAWWSIRATRDRLLKESDIKILPDVWENMSVSLKDCWTSYRKDLRDIPQTFSTPQDVIWPTIP